MHKLQRAEQPTLRDELEELQSRSEALNSALQAGFKKIRSLEAEKEDLNRRLVVANHNITTLHEDVSLKNKANEALEDSVITLRDELKTARSPLQETDAQAKTWKEAKCWLVERYRIPHGSVSDSLQTIVETSLDGTITKMTIKDPYMDQPHQRK